MSSINLKTLFDKLKVDENDPKIIERRKLLGKKLSYLKKFQYSVSRETVTDIVEENKKIGEGTFGHVYKAKHDGQEMAFKSIQLPLQQKLGVRLLREVIINRKLTHENVINFFDYWLEFDDRQNVWVNLFMELCETNLAEWYIKDTQRNYNQCKLMFMQICWGLQYIHNRKIIHRNLKPENILIDFRGMCKISNFGLSTFHSEKYCLYHTYSQGTYTYAAPERLNRKYHFKTDLKADIFSLGLILVTILVKFTDEKELKSVLISIKNDRDLPDIYKLKFNLEGKLILDMTENDPKLRPSINRVIIRSKDVFYNSMFRVNDTEAETIIRDTHEEIHTEEKKKINLQALLDKMEVEERRKLDREISYLNNFQLSSSSHSLMDIFQEKKQIGLNVFKIKYDGKEIAIKKVLLSLDRKLDCEFLRDFGINQQTAHENLINFYDYWIEFDKRYNVWIHLLMESCRINLKKWYFLDIERKLCECSALLTQIAHGLKYLHSNNIIHGNLKPENILIDFSGKCKLTDFGFTTDFIKPIVFKNSNFTSPEVFERNEYGFHGDIFSFGMIIVGLLVRFKNEFVLRSILGRISRDHELPEIYIFKLNLEGKLILKMTEHDPRNRPNINEVIQLNKIIFQEKSQHFGIKPNVCNAEEKTKRRIELLKGEMSYLKMFKIKLYGDILDEFGDTNDLENEKSWDTGNDWKKFNTKRISLNSNIASNLDIFEGLKINAKMSHQNLVKLHDHKIGFDNHNNLWINLYMDSYQSDLAKWFKDNLRDYKLCIQMFSQICSGLNYIHSKGIIHGDIKPSNIFIDLNGICKIGNLKMPPNEKTLEFTNGSQIYNYASPEQIKRLPFDFKVDIFPLGLIFMQFLMKFERWNSLYDALGNLREKGILPHEIKKSFTNEGKMILEMTKENPQERTNLDKISIKLTKLLTIVELTSSDSATNQAQFKIVIEKMKANAIK